MTSIDRETYRRDVVAPWYRDIALWVVVSGFIALSFAILVGGDFLPYVSDNNETYGLYVQAHNLARFDFSRTFGLADESSAIHSTGHPYIYTHQGKFSRLLPLVLYALGIHSVEGHIAVATYTIGLVSVVLAYLFFARSVSRAFALIYCGVLLTDYIFFMQWTVNADRNWNAYFLFSCLLCAQAMKNARSPVVPGVVTALNFGFLAYHEISLAIFVTAAVAAYSGWLHRHAIKRLLVAWGTMALGLASAVAILTAQVIALFGVTVFAKDFSYTYLSRNFAPTDPDAVAKIFAFFAEHRIVFWPNFVDASKFYGWRIALKTYFYYYLQVYTPALVYVVFVILAAVATSLVAPATRRVTTRLSGRIRMTEWPFAVAIGLAFAVFVYFWWPVFGDPQLYGFSPVLVKPGAWQRYAAGGGIIIGLAVGRQWRARGLRSSDALLLLGMFIVVCRWWAEYHSRLFVRVESPLWQVLLPWNWRGRLMNAVTIAAVLAGVSIIMRGHAGDKSDERFRDARAASPFVLACLAGVAVTYLLIPGYFVTGYMVLNVPLGVFLNSGLLALAISVLVGQLRLSESSLSIAPSGRWISVPAAVALGGLALMWVQVQVGYVRMLPPDHGSFLKILREPPFSGASFVVNGYPMPVRAMTGQWAYYDPKIGGGQIVLGDGGFVVNRDAFTFLWFADRDNNRDYTRPAYFLCFVAQSRATLVARLSGAWRAAGKEVDLRCQDVELIRRIDTGEEEYLFHRIIARDTTGRDRWTIVQLDWNYPPFLRPLNSAASGPQFLDLRFDRNRQVTVHYDYAQQDGAKEAAPLVRLYQVGTDLGCPPRDAAPAATVLSESTSQRVVIPRAFEGAFQVSVTPRTASKQGPEYFGPVLQWAGNAIRPAECAPPPAFCSPRSCSPRFLSIKEFSVTRLAGDIAALRWEKDPNAFEYRVSAERDGLRIEQSVVIGPRTTELNYPIAPGANYTFRAEACNPTGCSPPSVVTLLY